MKRLYEKVLWKHKRKCNEHNLLWKKRENETIYKQKLESFINQKTHICGKEFGDNNNKNLKIVTKIIIEIKVT